jgi:energy coupling factor transporter S component ThiW
LTSPVARGGGNTSTRKLALAGLFAALGVLLSLFAIPVGGARVLPFQHAINAVAGVVIGPWWAAGAALVAATLRFSLGTGSLFAFPGSPFGALVVGLVYIFLKRDEAALSEPLGTVLIGAPLGALLISPFLDLGAAGGVGVLMVSFALSSIPGAILGYLLLKALRRAGAIR